MTKELEVKEKTGAAKRPVLTPRELSEIKARADAATLWHPEDNLHCLKTDIPSKVLCKPCLDKLDAKIRTLADRVGPSK